MEVALCAFVAGPCHRLRISHHHHRRPCSGDGNSNGSGYGNGCNSIWTTAATTSLAPRHRPPSMGGGGLGAREEWKARQGWYGRQASYPSLKMNCSREGPEEAVASRGVVQRVELMFKVLR